MGFIESPNSVTTPLPRFKFHHTLAAVENFFYFQDGGSITLEPPGYATGCKVTWSAAIDGELPTMLINSASLHAEESSHK
jgi:hypothetical protein